MKKFLSIAFLMFMGAVSFAKNDTLLVGTNAEFPPFEYIQNGKIVGFEVDLIEEISKKIDRKMEFKHMAFDGLIPALQGKKIDMIISGMTITPERAKHVEFSDSYFTATQVLIVPESTTNITDLNSLKNKKVGVVLGFTGDIMISKIEEVNKNKIQYDSAPAAIMALKSGKIDAIILDSAPAKSYITKNKGLKIVNLDVEVEQYAIASTKKNKNLMLEINKALEEIKAEGIYDKLVLKYFK